MKITPEDKVKVLGFGLGKPCQAPSDGSQSPTRTEATIAGTIMGTAAYMSPEQPAVSLRTLVHSGELPIGRR